MTKTLVNKNKQPIVEKKTKKSTKFTKDNGNIVQKGGVDYREMREITGIPYLAADYRKKKMSEVYPGMPDFPPGWLNDCVIL